VPDPSELLAVARLLAASGAGEAPTEAQLRRAVSTTYYALFHKVLRAGADRFMGTGNAARPGYALIYRGFSHGRMKVVCIPLDVAALSPTLQRQLGATAVSQEMRDFASDFVALQDARLRADYDPQAVFIHSDAIDAVVQAELALQAFDRTTPDERADVLALMLAGARD
jgi:hypothetical protein